MINVSFAEKKGKLARCLAKTRRRLHEEHKSFKEGLCQTKADNALKMLEIEEESQKLDSAYAER